MSAVVDSKYAIEITEIEYLRHGNRSFIARIYRPISGQAGKAGKGPFPMMVEAHGGAWVRQDRMRNAMLDELMARGGVIVMGIDFRMPPTDPAYPASVADIHYAVRWLKSHAAQFGGQVPAGAPAVPAAGIRRRWWRCGPVMRVMAPCP